MSHPLERKVAVLRRSARRLVLAYGLSWLVGVVVAAVLVLGFVDYALHLHDVGLRVLALLALMGATGWAAWRYFWPALRAPFTDLQLAQRVEAWHPELRDRLSSSLQFLNEPEEDKQAGSASLRRTVIAGTAAELEQIDLGTIIERRPVRRAMWGAGAICALALVLVALDPLSARIALARLVNPLGHTVWPQRTHLAFHEAPRRVVLEQPFEVELVDSRGARLPDNAQMHYRYKDPDGTLSYEAEPLENVGGKLLARKEHVHRPFEYRATGGDDRAMQWTPLDVVEPATVERLSLTLHYPAYTGWPAEASGEHVRAITGTQVALEGRSSKPLRSVTLHRDPGADVPAQVGPDGRTFSIAATEGAGFVIEKSGAYWFELVDREGFSGGADVRYDIRAEDDLPPTLSFEEPAANIFVTAKAHVPLGVLVKDDLAVRDATLNFTRSDATQGDAETLMLYAAPAAVAPRVREASQGETRKAQQVWEIAALGLKPGSHLDLVATASDYRPQTGKSTTRRLTIITPEQLQDRLAERQAFILGELARILKLEREARAKVGEAQIQLEKVAKLQQADVDRLQASELTQRQVDRGLQSTTEGIPAHVDGLLRELHNNEVDSPDIERYMHRLLDEVNRLGQDALPKISQGLSSAIKTTQAELESGKASEFKAALPGITSAAAGQDAVAAALEALLADLSQWDNYRRFHREMTELKTEQQKLAAETAEAGKATLTQPLKSLTPQQQADLAKLGQRQNDLARDFENALARMEKMAAEVAASDPLASDTLGDAVREARQQAVAGEMRQAGTNVQQNQVGQAGAQQQKAAAGMQELMDILSHKRERELSRLVSKLKQTEQQIADLQKRQAALANKMKQAAAKPDDAERRRTLEQLTREQKQLQEEAERLSRLLKRLEADRAADRTASAGKNMSGAASKGQDQAQQAAEDAERAEKDLDDAAKAVAQQRKQAEQDLANEQIGRMQDGLKSMRAREQRTLEETRHYAETEKAEGHLSRPQLLSVRDLSREQSGLEAEARAQAEKLAGAEVFKLVLTGAASDMGRAAKLLGERTLGDEAQQAEAKALARLDRLLEALKPPKPGEKKQQQEGGAGQGGQPQAQQANPNAVPNIAQLKLLKLMQEEVNERTAAIEQSRKDMELTDAQRAEYAQLSQEQGSLADLMLNLAQAAQKPADDTLTPELPPDETKKPDANKPDAAKPDAANPESVKPEAAAPEIKPEPKPAEPSAVESRAAESK